MIAKKKKINSYREPYDWNECDLDSIRFQSRVVMKAIREREMQHVWLIEQQQEQKKKQTHKGAKDRTRRERLVRRLYRYTRQVRPSLPCHQHLRPSGRPRLRLCQLVPSQLIKTRWRVQNGPISDASEHVPPVCVCVCVNEWHSVLDIQSDCPRSSSSFVSSPTQFG